MYSLGKHLVLFIAWNVNLLLMLPFEQLWKLGFHAF